MHRQTGSRVKKGRSIRILSVSDVVAPEIYQPQGCQRSKKVDIIVSCGDLPPAYLSRLAHAFGAPLYYVSGNHDIRNKESPPEGGCNVHGRVISNMGISILGLEGCQWYNGGPYQYTESQMRSIIRRLRPTLWWCGGIDVVIAHAPPRHIHDAEDSCHKGFVCFRRLIEKYRPQYFIHGHIHQHFEAPSERVTIFNSTKVVNAYGYYFLEIEVAPDA